MVLSQSDFLLRLHSARSYIELRLLQYDLSDIVEKLTLQLSVVLLFHKDISVSHKGTQKAK